MRWIAALLVMLPSVALAEDIAKIDQSKAYASDAAACAAVKAGDPAATETALVLKFPQGIEGYEYYCDFFDVKSSATSSFLFVDAVCEVPGARNPDVLSISPYDDKSIEVVSLYDSALFPANEDNPNPGTTIFYSCN